MLVSAYLQERALSGPVPRDAVPGRRVSRRRLEARPVCSRMLRCFRSPTADGSRETWAV